jgi:hypothetical protein
MSEEIMDDLNDTKDETYLFSYGYSKFEIDLKNMTQKTIESQNFNAIGFILNNL